MGGEAFGLEEPFPRAHISDTFTFTTVAKSQLRRSNKIILWFGVSTTMRNYIKGHSIGKVENHQHKVRGKEEEAAN